MRGTVHDDAQTSHSDAIVNEAEGRNEQPALGAMTLRRTTRLPPGQDAHPELLDIGQEKYFMYQDMFDVDFDKLTDDAIQLFGGGEVQAADTIRTRPARHFM